MRRLIPLLSLVLLWACSTIDCPLTSPVGCKYQLAGEVTTLGDTLTITSTAADGSSILLLNRLVDASDFKIAMSYGLPSDRLFFSFTDTLGVTRTDTVTVGKTNIPHFESVDCSPAFYHLIGNVEFTRHVIDDIVITQPMVNHDSIESNLQIFIHPGH